jgi:predicted amidophosphoribosyltransferase
MQRYENAKNSYVLTEGASLFGRVLLVDDVVTTGATLNRCAFLLISCGAQDVFCLTAASTPIR